jgi:CIC family chloride channel protein
MKIDKLIEKDFMSIQPSANLGKLIELISKSNRNIFPVTDENKTFYGVVLLDKVREMMFKPELYNSVIINELMFMPPVLIDPADSPEVIVRKFQETGNFNLPVVNKGIYVGFISRARFFSTYRRMLKDFSTE